jgi:protein SCO1/2
MRVLPAHAGNAVERAASAVVGRPFVWALVLAALALWPVAWSARRDLPPPPPVLGTIAPFDLVDATGRSFGSEDLVGRVWIASFIATRCGDACESATRQLARIQARTRQLEPALHLVSFSVDPLHDTPDRLSEYARAHRASPRMWSFVTGPEVELRAIAKDALHPAAVGQPEPDAVLHGTELVLVDGAARIRGRYDTSDPGAVARVVLDAALLVNGRSE